jgi:hypothetical protein
MIWHVYLTNRAVLCAELSEPALPKQGRKVKRYNPLNPAAMFDDLFPEEEVLRLTRAIVGAYPQTERYLRRFHKAEAADVRPILRRAHVESAIRKLIESGRPTELRLETRRNGADNCSHLCLVCPGVTLTCCYVEARGSLPRETIFRRSYASSGQGEFDFAKLPSPRNCPLYAILTHGPKWDDESSAGFVDLVFPCSEYKHVVSRIPLLDGRLATQFGRMPEAEPEIIVPQTMPALRKSASLGKAQG